MKYLIRIEKDRNDKIRAFLYVGDGMDMEVKKPGGSRSIHVDTEQERKHLWNWIRENEGWSENERQDIIILAEEAGRTAAEALVQEAKNLKLDGMIVKPTEWGESQVLRFLRTYVLQDNGMFYQKDTRKFILPASGKKLDFYGLYDDMALKPAEKKPKALKKKPSMPIVQKKPETKKPASTAEQGQSSKSETKAEPRVFVKHNVPPASKAASKVLSKPKVQKTAAPAEKGKMPKPDGKATHQATDAQRHEFLKKQAEGYVFTVGSKDGQ